MTSIGISGCFRLESVDGLPRNTQASLSKMKCRLTMCCIVVLLLACCVAGLTAATQTIAPKSKSINSQKSPAKQSTSASQKKTAEASNLSKEFREAAMLAHVAIKQLEEKVSEESKVFDLYHEKAEKAMTVADARRTNSIDLKVHMLLTRLQIRVTGRRIEVLQEERRSTEERMRVLRTAKLGEPLPNVIPIDEKESAGKQKAWVSRYVNCEFYLSKMLSDGKYTGDGPCD